jgi:hypothetical protein
MLAQRIDALPGWRALNEVETAIGIVPLVAVGPGGVIAVDLTAMPQPGGHALADVPERGLIHAWAQAKHLERRRVGSVVIPVLALPGGPSGRRRGVQVLPLTQVDAWLGHLPPALDPAQIALILSRLEQDAPQTLLLAA